MPRPLFTPGKDPVLIVQEAGWAPGPVWTAAENHVHTGIRSPDRPARNQSLYRLSYRGPSQFYYTTEILRESVNIFLCKHSKCREDLETLVLLFIIQEKYLKFWGTKGVLYLFLLLTECSITSVWMLVKNEFGKDVAGSGPSMRKSATICQ